MLDYIKNTKNKFIIVIFEIYLTLLPTNLDYTYLYWLLIIGEVIQYSFISLFDISNSYKDYSDLQLTTKYSETSYLMKWGKFIVSGSFSNELLSVSINIHLLLGFVILNIIYYFYLYYKYPYTSKNNSSIVVVFTTFVFLSKFLFTTILQIPCFLTCLSFILCSMDLIDGVDVDKCFTDPYYLWCFCISIFILIMMVFISILNNSYLVDNRPTSKLPLGSKTMYYKNVTVLLRLLISVLITISNIEKIRSIAHTIKVSLIILIFSLKIINTINYSLFKDQATFIIESIKKGYIVSFSALSLFIYFFGLNINIQFLCFYIIVCI